MANLSNFQGWGANGSGIAVNDPGNGLVVQINIFQVPMDIWHYK